MSDLRDLPLRRISTGISFSDDEVAAWRNLRFMHPQRSDDFARRLCRDFPPNGRRYAAIRAAGIVHRDIKPTNVMLDRSDHQICVSIMDFGLARHYASETSVFKPGVIAGTPGYLAPELRQPPSRATDLFALGVLLH